MTPVTLALLIFAVMLVLMALRTPIAIAMFVAGVGRLRAAGRLAAVGELPQHPGLRALRQLRPVGDPAVHPDGQLRHAGRHLARRCSSSPPP